MIEAEWLTCTDPQPMMEFLEGQATDRKSRLFACACCRRIWRLFAADRSKRAVEVGERFADGQASREELNFACAAADMAHAKAPLRGSNFRALDAAPHAAEEDLSCSAADAAACAADAVQIDASGDAEVKEQECRQQAAVARCIFGNPFRPVTLSPSRLTPAVLGLAQAIYHERAFDRMHELADALQRAGCGNADILEHCRGPGPHARGAGWSI